MFKKMLTSSAGRIVLFALVLAACVQNTLFGQALNMDGQSGIFFQPWADIVPSPRHQFGAPTMSFHVVDAGPIAGDYLNVGVEEGFGNWLEFGFTRNNHTDGGDPTISPLFNFAGMNMFKGKAYSCRRAQAQIRARNLSRWCVALERSLCRPIRPV
jgi:hypothetical protein